MRFQPNSLRSAPPRNGSYDCSWRVAIVTLPNIVPELKASMPQLRGRLLAEQSLAEFTWFRVGGPAQALFMPEDDADLAYFLSRLPSDVSVTPIGLGSNLIVRDGGVPGVVVRLGRGFNEIAIEPDHCIRAGADSECPGIGLYAWNDIRGSGHLV